MATLEELLTDDGFKRRRNKPKPWLTGGTARSSAASLLISPHGSSGSRIRPMRTRPDVNPRLRPSNAAGRRLRSGYWHGEQSPEVQQLNGRVLSSLKESKEFEGCSGKNQQHACFIEEPDAMIKSFLCLESKNGSFDKVQENLGYNMRFNNNLYENVDRKGKKTQNSQVKPSFKDVRDGCPMPPLDEAALKPIISMLNSCVNQFLKDESFRSSVHQACVSSLKSTWVKYRKPKDSGVISTLIEAMRAVERIITEGSNTLELKKAFVKLSVITGLKSMESDDGHTCGILNSHLAACGHLYLSILYKIQKKDKMSAKHLLQVFCDSPHQARTTLLPGLWDRLFLPNLSHVKAWYDKEVESIPVTSDVMMMLDFIEKVYNDIVDMGTSQFAAYYNGRLVEDSNGPAVPSILIPFASVPDKAEDANEVVSYESFSLSNSVPSNTMISKRLYESVLAQAKRNKTTDEMESGEEDEKVEVGDETEEGQSDVWRKNYDPMQKHDENVCESTKSGTSTSESSQEYYDTSSQFSAASFEIMLESNETKENYCCSSSSGILEAEEIKPGSEMVRFSHDINGCLRVRMCDPEENENGFKLKKLAKEAFQLQVTYHSDDANTFSPKLSIDSPVYYSDQDEMTKVTCTELVIDETDTTDGLFGSCSLKKKSSDILLGHHEDDDQGSLFSRIPKEFICPLTGKLLKEPVTLESGYTFELVAIKDRFNQGNRTCPVTGQSLKCSPIPDTNIVLKHLINVWVAECFRNSLALVSQSTFSPLKQVHNSKHELCLLIIEHLLTGFCSKEGKGNIEHLISLGGLQFLTGMFDLGSLEVKSRVAGLLIQCIQADGRCTNHLAMHISKSSLLALIHSKQVQARTRDTSLLIELICLNRRMDITSCISGLKTEDIGNTKHELLFCLQSSLPEERVLVAVLLLHLDLLEESQMYSVYKEKAVKCIIAALECCLFNKKFIANCRRALLMLGGHFSFSGEIVTETWLLKKAGYDCNTYNDEDDQTISEEESRMGEHWLKSMALILLHHGKKSFLETLSKCWKSGDPDLVRACVVTTAWLSHAIASLSVHTFQLSAFSALMPRLNECLKSDLDIELKVLASFSLLNFSKILECRIPLIKFVDEIHDPLKSLKEVTWTAKHLYNDLFEETP